MRLGPGDSLGAFEIVSPLGAGGMGEVYRARDTRLDRDVAIKVLPDAISRDKEGVLCFECEVNLLAWLNHANVAAAYALSSRTR